MSKHERDFRAQMITRTAEVITRKAPEAGVRDAANTITVCWSTGATVQRVRWEGWDDRIEYEEELVVSPDAVRLDFLNSGGPFLDSHWGWSLDSVLGSVVPGSARIEGGKAYADIRLTSAPGSSDIVQKIMEGTVRFVSVGYKVHEYQITRKEGEKEQWRAIDWEPMEISAVAMPADTGATIQGERGAKPLPYHACRFTDLQGHPAAPAAFTRSTTMPKSAEEQAAETRAAEAAAAAAAAATTAATTEGQRAAPAAAATPAAPAAGAAVPDQAALTASRAAGIQDLKVAQDLCVRHGLKPDFATGLIEKGQTLDQVRTAILDEIAKTDTQVARGGAPAFAQARGEDTETQQYREAVENSLLHRADPAVHKLTERGREFMGMSLLELGKDSLERRGVRVRGMGQMDLATAIVQRAVPGMMGTSDFPYILANVANKSLRSAYESTPRTFQAWAKRATIKDFKPISKVSLGGAPDLLRVPESGEFTYGSMGEAKEAYQLYTYGRIIAITRQALINDDLSAFTRIPAAFGASAADLESDIVYGVLTTNAALNDGVALFHATHGNLGTAAVIGETSLTDMFRKFAAMRGIEGRQISVPPRHVLVPPGQRALEIAKAMTQTTPNQTSQVNAYAGRLVPVEEVRLIPASGEDPWYVTADPSRIDTVEYAYLEGQEGIHTETRIGFEVDGVEIKARHDFAAAALDYRGMYKNPGAAPA